MMQLAFLAFETRGSHSFSKIWIWISFQ